MGFNSGFKGLSKYTTMHGPEKVKWQYKLDVRGSVHRNIIHTEITNKMQQCIRIYYYMFIWSSTCFGRHTSHHEEFKNCTSSLWFYIRVRLLDVEIAGAVLELLMMIGVSLETCWASYKHGIIDSDTLLHFVGHFFIKWQYIWAVFRKYIKYY